MLALVVLLAGCDPSVTVDLEVVVPASLQSSLTFPVQVAWESDQHFGGSRTICELSADDVVLSFEETAIGCAEPFEVRAALGPWEAPATGCVETEGTSYGNLVDDALATGTATAFADDDDNACTNGTDSLSITLQ